MRPRIEISIDQIEELAGRGLTQQEICLCLGISDQTLLNRKRENLDFLEAMKRGRAKAAQQVSDKLFELATAGDMTAIIWYEKTRRGMSDRVQQQVTINVKQMSDDELRALTED